MKPNQMSVQSLLITILFYFCSLSCTFGQEVKDGAPSTEPSIEAQRTEWRGMYVGSVTLPIRDQEIPIVFSIQSFHQTFESTDNQGVVQKQAVTASSFVIDDDGGPYRLRSVEIVYASNPTRIRLYYSKGTGASSDDLMFDAVGSPLTVVTQSNGSSTTVPPTLTGNIVSGTRGFIGTFSVKKVGINASSLITYYGPAFNYSNGEIDSRPDSKWLGSWKGTWKFSSGSIVPLSLLIRPSPTSKLNPVFSELAFTNGKQVSAVIEGQDFLFSIVTIDYFTQEISMTYTDPESGSTLSLVGTLDDDFKIVGRGSAAAGAEGIFTLNKTAGPDMRIRTIIPADKSKINEKRP